MEEGFYVPQLEEIYFGFEFEVYNSRKYFFFEAAEGWRKTSIDYGVLGNIANIHKLILEKQIRVKYLNKKDIKSLGWEHSPNDDGEEYPNLHDKHGYSLGFSIDKQLTPLNTAFILHYFSDHYLIIDSIFNCGSGREQMLFRGYIKNKSELKKVMQMLGL